MSAARFSTDRLEALLVRQQTRDDFIESAVWMEQNWGSPGFPRPEADVRAEAGLCYDRGAGADGINRQALATMAAGDRRAALAEIALPCLVIHGSDDALIPPDAGREIAALIPGAELEVIEGMGHVITPSLAPLIVDRVATFIDGQS